MLLKINEIVYCLTDVDITDIDEMFCPYGLVEPKPIEWKPNDWGDSPHSPPFIKII